ncbi:hypothetical protein [Bifidobacterium aquikefiri]|uniref:Uncharacterized protein n=1 Tax=Bifidobacterium aquikefiri TaxID=1653207 RepID=A0A261GB60_9BIFI|nr:hypothetical protein [Bifidobacterium aquikefiri]OZG68473.1 hypothetical protein BAQU_0291 [Bifidobacterium aquikefiri]
MSSPQDRLNESNEDSSDVSAAWKKRAENLADAVADMVDYKDGMIVVPHPR